MGCSNTVSDGFYFWIGKVFAELSIGLSIAVLFGIAYFLIYWYTNKK